MTRSPSDQHGPPSDGDHPDHGWILVVLLDRPVELGLVAAGFGHQSKLDAGLVDNRRKEHAEVDHRDTDGTLHCRAQDVVEVSGGGRAKVSEVRWEWQW